MPGCNFVFLTLVLLSAAAFSHKVEDRVKEIYGKSSAEVVAAARSKLLRPWAHPSSGHN